MLISKLAGIPCDKIPDNHPDVIQLSDISAEELSNRLWKLTDSDVLEAYFVALGLDKVEAVDTVETVDTVEPVETVPDTIDTTVKPEACTDRAVVCTWREGCTGCTRCCTIMG